MLQRCKRVCRPTTLLLVIGFSISLTAVLTGISTLNTLVDDLTSAEADLPIRQVMQNTGLALSVSIYLFSIINGFVVTNYWMITQRRELAIRKAFGWTNRQLLGLLCRNMAKILLASLGISGCLLAAWTQTNRELLSLELTPLFAVETMGLLFITLALSMIVPAKRIMTIEPAEVIAS